MAFSVKGFRVWGLVVDRDEEKGHWVYSGRSLRLWGSVVDRGEQAGLGFRLRLQASGSRVLGL